ncbi:hypothetical protein PsYK624_137440 [Phanerochaete sordida]|uniref:Uncharacterized protein n=1 Tax=Phanerochaete sordida TaxID=48140 RepID=A0A9P3GM80_9APHY|nr:hypothetical protein PsYK624_137440 [Phanerochaete sordida]
MSVPSPRADAKPPPSSRSWLTSSLAGTSTSLRTPDTMLSTTTMSAGPSCPVSRKPSLRRTRPTTTSPTSTRIATPRMRTRRTSRRRL